MQDASELWLVDNPEVYALQAIHSYFEGLPTTVREQLGLNSIVSPHVVVEACIIVDCNKEKALIVRLFDPGFIPRSALPQNYDWKQVNKEERRPSCCQCQKVLSDDEISPKTPNVLVQGCLETGNSKMAEAMRRVPNIMQGLAMKCSECGKWMCADCGQKAFNKGGSGVIMHACGGWFVSV